jgi:hypothetical protein
MICRSIILESLLGPLQAIVSSIHKNGLPNALYERPRKRKNFADNFVTALS